MKFLSWFALYLSFGKNWLKASCIILKTYQIDFISWIANSKNPEVHTYLKEVNTRNQNIVLHTSNNLDSMANLKKVVVCFVLLRSGIDCKPHRIHPNIANTSQVWKSRSLKVVGGSDSNNHEFPWMVGVRTKSGKCGGSIITKNLVMTAAHCVFNSKTQELKQEISILMGHSNISSALIKKEKVESVLVHPQNDNKQYYNDVALLRLTKDLEFDNSIQPIALSNNGITGDLLLLGNQSCRYLFVLRQQMPSAAGLFQEFLS